MTHCNGGRVRWGSGIGITAMFAAGLAAFGSTWTWTGEGTNDLWSEAANWLQGTKPSSHSTTRLVFDGTTRLTPEQDIDRDFQFNSLVFSNNAALSSSGAPPILTARPVGSICRWRGPLLLLP